MFACHAAHEICGNRRCVAPRHLREDTPSSNTNDRITDGTDDRGRKARWNKLTEKQVLAIYNDLRTTWAIDKSGEFPVSRGTISAIKSRKTWAWLTGAQ
jgi:hypothetical protein